MFMKGVGAYGRLHSLLWLDVLKDLEGAFHIHQCPAQQKGSSVRRWIDLQFTFVEAEHHHDHEHLQLGDEGLAAVPGGGGAAGDGHHHHDHLAAGGPLLQGN